VRVLLVNPNTNSATTAMMLAMARSYAPADWDWATWTAPHGSALIADPQALAVAAEAVADMRDDFAGMPVDAVIVAAFGDPGMQALRDALPMPVYGIGESALLAADRLGLPYSILTIAPQLRESTLQQVSRSGCDRHFRSLVITEGDAQATARSQDSLLQRIRACIDTAVHAHGARVLVIGGGPVAAAAQVLRDESQVRTILPLQEAVARVAAGDSIPH
jgi:allantoin racemase